MSDGWAIFDSGPGALRRQLDRLLAPKPKPSWPRVADEQYKGDPFLKLIESAGQHYVFDEAALIEDEERMFREWRFLGA